MDRAPPPTTIQCARCGEPAALVCKGCTTEDPISRSLVVTTRYCGVPYQKKDWVHHKALCKATKAIREFWILNFETRGTTIKDIQSWETKTSELQTPEPQPHESPPHASHLHEPRPNEPQAHGLQAHKSPPYQVHQDQASFSEAKEAHQTKKNSVNPTPLTPAPHTTTPQQPHARNAQQPPAAPVLPSKLPTTAAPHDKQPTGLRTNQPASYLKPAATSTAPTQLYDGSTTATAKASSSQC